TKRIVLAWYEAATLNVGEMVTTQNPKGRLQELAAKKSLGVKYRLASQSGPDHDKKFEMEVLIGDVPYASATASSKKEAEIKAAQIALEKFV
ncbi:MAG: hypothetical protein J6T16_04795, partial [Opitutales bacterium]|nr:hypothetical protein [Opitutales bacterium]